MSIIIWKCIPNVFGRLELPPYNREITINTSDKILYQYKEAGDFNEGLATVKKCRYKFYIDKNGEVSIDAGYDEADMFRSGLAVAKIGANEGFIDHDGDMQLLPYDKIYGFRLLINGKWPQ